MEILPPALLAVFFAVATAGYAWATMGRGRVAKSPPTAGDVKEALTPVPKAPKDKTSVQPQSVAPQAKVQVSTSAPSASPTKPRFGGLLPHLSKKTASSNPAPASSVKPRSGGMFQLFSRGKGSSASAKVVTVGVTESKGGQQAPNQTPIAVQVPTTQTTGTEPILIDSYVVRDPFVRIGISQEIDGSNRYIVIEPRLTKKEKTQLAELKETLKNGLEVDVTQLTPGKATAYLSDQTKEIMDKFGIKLPKDTYEKLFYFIERDFLHYGRIDPIMRDPNIEDISCNGPLLPVYVFHRTYESIPTSVAFKTQEALEKFVLRLAYMSGRHISVAEPMVDASLPDGSRVQMTFGSEITKKGSTFTIRKFKEDPFSVIDLIKFGTLTSEIAALMWYALDNKSSVMLAGGTASGKTTTINCLLLFIRPEAKIITLEDTPEINLAHKNWIQSISRQGMSGMGEVTLYDLLRAALRQRPDFIVPGEVRGEEAQTMFQAISTGHAGMSSIHADSIAAVFHRLTNPPMNIPRTLLPALNFVLLQGRVSVKGKPVRRILSVTEVVGLDTRSNELITNELYRFNPENDSYVYSGRSYILEKLAKTKGATVEEVRQEIETRKQILEWMASRGLRRYREVADVVQRYYSDKPSLLAELGAMPA